MVSIIASQQMRSHTQCLAAIVSWCLGVESPCLCVVRLHASSFNQSWKVIMSLFHFSNSENVKSLSLSLIQLTVISVLTFLPELQSIFIFIRVVSPTFLFQNDVNIYQTGGKMFLKLKHHFCIWSQAMTPLPGYQWPSPRPSAPHHGKVLVTAPDCRW